MKAHELLDALGGIDERYIREASEEIGVKKRRIGWAAAAACLCLAAAVLLSAFLLNPPSRDPDPTRGETAGSIYVPALKPAGTNKEGDMFALVVYRGGIYTQSGSYWDEDGEKIREILVDYLGYADGSLDELSAKEDYEREFASSVSGKVYAVKGYDTAFRVCVLHEVTDADGKPAALPVFLDRLNGISLSAGKDLFGDRLHLRGRVASVLWQSHKDWNLNGGNFQSASVDESAWNAFLDALDRGEFIFADTPTPGKSFYEGHYTSTIFDTPDQTHLILKMDDGISLRLRLIKGGYVGYEAVGWRYFVRIPHQAFDAVYDSCGGTRSVHW